MNKLLKPESVADGITTSVVVKVDENFFAGSLPFTDPVGPPGEVIIGVRTTVEVMMVGAM